MTVTEIKQALGSWSLRLRSDTPRTILDQLTYFGHIAILPGRVDVKSYGDSLLAAARYVGVLRGKDAGEEFEIRGPGMAYWLGDEDGKGDVFEAEVSLTAQTFAASMTALLPAGGSVIAGTINSVAGTYTGKHRWQTPREALTYVADLFAAEWRVTNDAKLDAGTVAQLYGTTPRAIIMRKGVGRDFKRKALPGNMSLDTDVEDYSTRVVLLAEGEGESIKTGAATAGSVPYKDIRGNNVKLTRLVSESGTDPTNATVRAQLQLNRFSGKRNAVQLSTDSYDVKGDLVVGEYVDVWDPDSGFIDPSREVYWESQPINPIALRCVEMSWPVEPGWTVAFRDTNGNWIDLSQYYAGETGQTTITVGDFNSSLTGSGGEPVGTRPNTGPGSDGTIPGAPTFIASSTGVYEVGRRTESAVRLEWSQPLNTDSSTIIDGSHYELRWRPAKVIGYVIDWDLMDDYTWDDFGGWDALLSNPITATTQWSYATIGFDTRIFTVYGLNPGVQYEFQVRAVDNATPSNRGAWSSAVTILTSGDIIAPSAPAPPIVAASLIGVQVTHFMGKASGGQFNLEADLDHLEVHVGGDSAFGPSDATRVGTLRAHAGLMLAGIPAVATFKVDAPDSVWVKVVAVDNNGNRSPASAAASSIVSLIDSAHISDLTVSKITAGTITASWLMAGEIKTADAGARVSLDSKGFHAYDADGSPTVDIDSQTGNAEFVGKFLSGRGADFIKIDPAPPFPEVVFSTQPNPNGSERMKVKLRSLAWNTTHGQLGMLHTSLYDPELDHGGIVSVAEKMVGLEYFDNFGSGTEAELTLGGYPDDASLDRIFMSGFLTRDRMNSDGKVTFFVGFYAASAGVAGVTITYNPGVSGSSVILTGMGGTSAEVLTVTSSTTTNFALEWTNSAIAHNVFYCSIRTIV